MKLDSKYISKEEVVDFIEWFDQYQKIMCSNICLKDADYPGENNEVEAEIFEWKDDNVAISIIKMTNMITLTPVYAQVSVITENECIVRYTSNSLVIKILERFYRNSKIAFNKCKYGFDLIMSR